MSGVMFDWRYWTAAERIGPDHVEHLEHVLLVARGCLARRDRREQLAGFQVLQPRRSSELGPGHRDLRVYQDPTGDSFTGRDESNRLHTLEGDRRRSGRKDFRKKSCRNEFGPREGCRVESKSRASREIERCREPAVTTEIADPAGLAAAHRRSRRRREPGAMAIGPIANSCNPSSRPYKNGRSYKPLERAGRTAKLSLKSGVASTDSGPGVRPNRAGSTAEPSTAARLVRRGRIGLPC